MHRKSLQTSDIRASICNAYNERLSTDERGEIVDHLAFFIGNVTPPHPSIAAAEKALEHLLREPKPWLETPVGQTFGFVLEILLNVF